MITLINNQVDDKSQPIREKDFMNLAMICYAHNNQYLNSIIELEKQGHSPEAPTTTLSPASNMRNSTSN